MSLRRPPSLALALLALLTPGLASQDAVRIHARSTLYRGERVNVHVTTAERGYLLVLRADTYGRVHVLYPRRPTDDAWVGADWKVQIRGARGRHAFEVTETQGEGFLLAALAWERYDLSTLTTDGEWDRGALGQQRIGIGVDAEAGLVEIVRTVTAERDFDYDIVAYQVVHRPYVVPLTAHYYDRWDLCEYDAFDYYQDYYAYRAWCRYPWGFGGRWPYVVITAPAPPPGPYRFKDRPIAKRPPFVEPRRRTPIAVGDSPFRIGTRSSPVGRDVARRDPSPARRSLASRGRSGGGFGAAGGSAWSGRSGGSGGSSGSSGAASPSRGTGSDGQKGSPITTKRPS